MPGRKQEGCRGEMENDTLRKRSREGALKPSNFATRIGLSEAPNPAGQGKEDAPSSCPPTGAEC
jgi:hypothetical protein